MSRKKSGNPSGIDRSSRTSRTSLAAQAREVMKDGELIIKFYVFLAGGDRPEFVYEDSSDPDRVTGVKRKAKTQYQDPADKVTIDQQALAANRLKEMGYGMAPQYQIIEHDVQIETQHIHTIDPRLIQKVAPEALKKIKSALLELEAADEVIEAEFVEKDA